MSFQMFVPTKALFGAGQLNHLHEQDLPGKKALLVISNGKSTKVNGYLDRTEKELHTAGVETVLFDQVEANPLSRRSCAAVLWLGNISVTSSWP